MRASISKIRLFKSCRRAYEFKYIENLVPVQRSEALEIGTGYHEKLEALYNDGEFDSSDYNKESAMATAYKKYIYPKFKVKSAEEWFDMSLELRHRIVGIVDGISEDGHLVEHKTTSISNIEEYVYNLQWDEQILMYMLASGSRKMYYTIIRKPTIRMKKNESDEEFFNRMVEWYDEDTATKINVVEVERTNEEVSKFRDDLVNICDEMDRAEKEHMLYRNPSYCNHWGRMCEYAPICMNYDPEMDYIEFEKKETKK